MRRLFYLLAVTAFAAPSAGCEWLKSSRETGQKQPAGPLTKRPPAEFVGFLNTQAGYLKSVSYKDVRLTATENGRTMPSLGDCTLDCAQPRNFRLNCGTLVTSNEIDLGSNDQQFWMYVKRMDSPNFFFASHDDYARGTAKFPIPFDPDWVLMALGMTTYDANGTYETRVNEKQSAHILEQRTTRQGLPITKVTVFANDWNDGKKPAVRGHHVYDAANKRICSADIRAAKYVSLGTDPVTGKPAGVQIPTRVVLEWPQQNFSMDLTLSNEKVNEDLSRETALFTRPNISGANPIDLATHRFSSFRGQSR